MRHRLSAALLALALTFGLLVATQGFATPSASAATRISGVWKGPVTQPGFGPYRVKVNVHDRLRKGRVGAKVKYPGLGCRGKLVLIKKKSPRKFVFRERLTVQANCIDRGRVVLKRRDNKVKYAWTGGGTRATATLKRIRR